MRRFLWFSLGVLLLASVVVASSGGATQAEARWVITDLGLTNEGAAINDRGQIVGSFYPGGGRLHAFLWQDGKMRDLGTLGGDDSDAVAINDRGQVVGSSDTRAKDKYGDPLRHGFLWQNGKMRDLGSFWPEDINNRGQIVGHADTKAKDEHGDPIPHAFLWQNGRMRDLGTLGGHRSIAVAINDRGQITGMSETKKGEPYVSAFLWENGKMRLLAPQTKSDPVLAPWATDINDRGQVVGEWRLHPFLWQDGKIRDLGLLGKQMTGGEALGINERGQVVGASYSEEDEHEFYRAFLWEKGTMIALPRLPGGGEYEEADDINNQGQIVGWGKTKSGETHAVLWTLKP